MHLTINSKNVKEGKDLIWLEWSGKAFSSRRDGLCSLNDGWDSKRQGRVEWCFSWGKCRTLGQEQIKQLHRYRGRVENWEWWVGTGELYWEGSGKYQSFKGGLMSSKPLKRALSPELCLVVQRQRDGPKGYGTGLSKLTKELGND